MQHTSPLYWNVLSFSFTIIEFSLAISSRVVMQHTSCYHPPEYCGLVISFRMDMQHTSPLAKGRKRGDYLCRTDVKNYKRWTHKIVRPSLFCYHVLSKPPFHLQKRMRPESIMIYFRGAGYIM